MNLFPVSTTGDLTDENEKLTVTVPVPLPIVFSQIEGAYTAFDRKLWLLLLHLEWDNILTKSKVGEWHEIKESELRTLIEKHTGSKDTEQLWDSAKRLTKTTVEYRRVDENDRRWKGITSLFMAEILEKHEREGYFRFMFPSPLVPIIREPGRFARLRLQFLLKLNSKYAITLYQVLESVTNLRAPVLEATVEEIRGWLKIPEGKLNQWDYLNKYALSPALTEINSNPELSGINVTHELIRSGRGGKVQKIKFTVNKTDSRIDFEKDIKISKKAKQIAHASTFIPPFQGTTIYEKAKKLASSQDVYALEREWREWVSTSDVVVKKPEAHFMAFVKRKNTERAAS